MVDYYDKGRLAHSEGADAYSSLVQWYAMDDVPTADIADKCDVATLTAALAPLAGVEVVSATVNRTGVYEPALPPQKDSEAPPPSTQRNLPDFCDVRVRKVTPGGHVAEILIWVPLAWNGRFLATGGVGSLTGPLWFDLPVLRSMTMSIALRNGFATAATDGGNRDPRFSAWPLDERSGELDRELMRNWSYRSTHDMAVASKLVVQALHGTEPRYSYYAGCSGGGRQGVASALQYPGDFDGIWASDPAINWNSTFAAALWPSMVMKEFDNPLPEAKLEAFRRAALDACDGADGVGDGFIGAFDPVDFDAAAAIGTLTEAGPLTERDAEVMNKIWGGPRRTSGERLYHGLRPGTASWGQSGMMDTAEVDGRLVPNPAPPIQSQFKWITEDLSFDWTTLSYERYEELIDLGREKLAEFAVNDPDLSGLRDSGGKLLITQGAEDSIIPYSGAVDYYKQITNVMGGLERVRSFVRLFVTDGDIHGAITGPGPGLTIAAAMTALMEWVENGTAPEEIIATHVDPLTGSIDATRPAYAYPLVTRYSGAGDPREAESYIGKPLAAD